MSTILQFSDGIFSSLAHSQVNDSAGLYPFLNGSIHSDSRLVSHAIFSDMMKPTAFHYCEFPFSIEILSSFLYAEHLVRPFVRYGS